MQWNSVQDFFHMGGYALYVWGSFGLTAAVVAVEALLARQRLHRIQRELHQAFATPSSDTL
ncbi:MAG: heme exporter protein CcmD [Rhodoferax sp.]